MPLDPLFHGESDLTQGLYPTKLATIGWDIATLLAKIEYAEVSTLPGYSSAAWEHESDRFRLWSDNLGLYHEGHSSLDYRLREAGALLEFVRKLLVDFKKLLETCVTSQPS